MTAPHSRPATSIRLLCEAAVARGIAVPVALAGTGLSPADLADADVEVTVEQEVRAIENVAAVYPAPAGLGIDVGERMHVNAFGIWGFAVLTSPTFRAAVETAMAHIRLSFVLAEIDYREDADHGRLIFDLRSFSPPVQAYVLERHSMVTLLFSREVVGSAGLGAFTIETTRGSEYATALQRRIGLQVSPDRAADAIVFPADVLDLAVPRSDPITLKYCLEQCELLSSRLDEVDQPWSVKVRDVLVEDIAADNQISVAAGRLAVNERTLRRRLAEEGTSFREIYADTRLSIARELLETAGLSVEAVARRVGYAEPASFVRAFSRHFGETPGRVRRSLTG